MPHYRIIVTDADGEDEQYACDHPSGKVSEFATLEDAQEMESLIRGGIDEDTYSGVRIVKFNDDGSK